MTVGLIVGLASMAAVLSAGASGQSVVERCLGVWDAPPKNVPTTAMPDGPLLGNGDLGAVIAGPANALRFHIAKNDFWSRLPGDARILTVGAVRLGIPALRGASYRLEQDVAHAEARGVFTRDGVEVRTRSRVCATGNLLITELTCQSGGPLAMSVGQTVGPYEEQPSAVAESPHAVNVGREQWGGGRWYFDGAIDGLRIVDRGLTPEEVAAEAARPHGDGEVFDGRSTWHEVQAPRVEHAVTVSAWIRIGSISREANYVVSKGEWNQAYSLGLSKGKLRWAVNGARLQSNDPLPVGTWLHVAGTFDGHSMRAYVNGAVVARRGGDEGGGIDAAKGLLWFTRRADDLPGTARRVAVATRVLAPCVLDEAGRLAAQLRPGQPVYVVTAVLSDLDARDPLGAARRRALSIDPPRVAKELERHRAWWARYWSRSAIEIADKEIEKHWYGALYVLGSCSRAGKVAPGLWGSWVTTDNAGWHGDYHLNYNFQAPYYLAYSANHADLTEPFYRAIGESAANGRAMAARHGWKGIHFPVCIGPWGLAPENPDQDWGQRSDAAFAALNFIWQYQYTQDLAFLRTAAYPYLCEVGDFWEDYLRFEGGRYVITSDSIHEGSGPDMNPLLSLGLVRTLFANLISMSEDLGVDEDRRPTWRHILDRLSDYPLQERGGKTVFRYSEKGMAWCDGNTLGIHHIFPAGAIGLDSSARLLQISSDMVEAMARWEDYNGFASWYTACARIGYDPATILARMRRECSAHGMPNLLLYYGGGGIESVGGLLAINEMLLQSHDGVIRLFPCWPRDLDARFETLRARGAFLVSAALEGGAIGSVRIVSERGRPCTVLNPWPGSAVRVVRGGRRAETLRGERFTFATRAGGKVTLEPAR